MCVAQDSDLTEALANALQEARHRRARAAAELEAAEKVVQALEFTMGIHAGGDSAVPVPLARATIRTTGAPKSVDEWRRLSRRAAILSVLAEYGRPISPKDLGSELHRRGRTDGYNGVSASLSRLKDDGKVESAGYGLWQLPTDAEAEPETEGRLAVE